MRTIYIFLDIDGVLNSESAFIYNYQQYKKGIAKDTVAVVDEQRLIIFNDLCERIKKADCKFKIILSSTWRKSNDLIKILEDRLNEYNLTIDDMTCHIGSLRGYQISHYCESHNISKDDVVILDDDNDMDNYIDRLINTYFRDGLTYSDTEKALILLGLEEQVWKSERI